MQGLLMQQALLDTKLRTRSVVELHRPRERLSWLSRMMATMHELSLAWVETRVER